jgi:hypothetical protein
MASDGHQGDQSHPGTKARGWYGVGASQFGSWTYPSPIDRQLTSKASLVTLGNVALDGIVKGE